MLSGGISDNPHANLQDNINPQDKQGKFTLLDVPDAHKELTPESVLKYDDQTNKAQPSQRSHQRGVVGNPRDRHPLHPGAKSYSTARRYT